MINELVNSILEAEAKADGIISEASAKAEAVSLEASKKISAINLEADNTLRAESDALNKCYADKADELYAKILAEGKANADGVLEEAKTKTEKFSDEVVRGILSGNC